MQQSRVERLERIAAAEAIDEEPKQRDVRRHRRTLAHRSRKRGRLSLTITDRRLFEVSHDGQVLSSRQCGFTLRLRASPIPEMAGHPLDSPRSGAKVRPKDAAAPPALLPSRAGSPCRSRRHWKHWTSKSLGTSSAPTAARRTTWPSAPVTAPITVVVVADAAENASTSDTWPASPVTANDGTTQSPKTVRGHDVTPSAATQEMRRQIRDILLEAKPKMLAVESLHPISLMASARGTAVAPGKNVAAKRKLNDSLAESAIGHVGKLLREEAAKLGISTVSAPPHGTSQTCPCCGDRHPNNRESQAVFRCRNCGRYAHADWTAAVIICNRAYVRHCEWQHGYTPDVLTAPTGVATAAIQLIALPTQVGP